MSRKSDPPSPIGESAQSKGRTATGRFALGNSGGPGNPYGKRTAWLRAALLDAFTPDDIRAVALILVARAKDGDLAAIRELFDRALGKSIFQEVDTAEPEPLQSLSDAQLNAVARTIMGKRASQLVSRVG
jgi:hypothetical protein